MTAPRPARGWALHLLEEGGRSGEEGVKHDWLLRAALRVAPPEAVARRAILDSLRPTGRLAFKR